MEAVADGQERKKKKTGAKTESENSQLCPHSQNYRHDQFFNFGFQFVLTVAPFELKLVCTRLEVALVRVKFGLVGRQLSRLRWQRSIGDFRFRLSTWPIECLWLAAPLFSKD